MRCIDAVPYASRSNFRDYAAERTHTPHAVVDLLAFGDSDQRALRQVGYRACSTDIRLFGALSLYG